MCRTFIWASKTPRLSWDRLVLPKLLGGLGLPDIQKYHWACHLTRIVDWHLHRSNKAWITLEDSFTKTPLSHLPWINHNSIPRDLVTHPFIGATLSHLKLAGKALDYTPHPGPMTPLVRNPDFLPGLALRDLHRESCTAPIRAHHFFQNGELLPHQAMAAKLTEYNIPFYKYLQLRHFFTDAKSISLWYRERTPFELLCDSSEPQRHVISTVYTFLFSNCKIKDDKLIRRWESELSIDLTSTEWERIHNHIHKGSINVSTQENRYKIFTNWYRTPDKIHKMHPSVPPTCWRCNAALGTLIHIWWECPLIIPYWTEIHRLITQITSYAPDFTPAQYMLHHTSMPLSSYKKSLTLHLINAANLCVPVHWRSSTPPTVAEWFKRVDRTAEMEKLIY